MVYIGVFISVVLNYYIMVFYHDIYSNRLFLTFIFVANAKEKSIYNDSTIEISIKMSK